MTASIKSGKAALPRRGGRPSLKQAELIEGQILDVARDLFFFQGYGATSIEMIAREARISKRTFYHRFKDKADIFKAVVHRLIENLRPADTAALFKGGKLEDLLLRVAEVVLGAALKPQTLSLHRMILAEATRFPELALVMNEEGARREAVTRVAELLEHEAGPGSQASKHATFAAEQFLQMVVSLPQRRAFGLGKPMTPEELKEWARNTVSLFLRGWQSLKSHSS
jgi:AcrR family transcriptional regulator